MNHSSPVLLPVAKHINTACSRNNRMMVILFQVSLKQHIQLQNQGGMDPLFALISKQPQ
jgi:hypothetical protein